MSGGDLNQPETGGGISPAQESAACYIAARLDSMLGLGKPLHIVRVISATGAERLDVVDVVPRAFAPVRPVNRAGVGFLKLVFRLTATRQAGFRLVRQRYGERCNTS